MKIAALNASPSAYNLGVEKILNYHRRIGDRTTRYLDMFDWDADKVYISAIFTWDLPRMVKLYKRARLITDNIELGGPAVTKLSNWVEEKTGIKPFVGLNGIFDKEFGEYDYTFTSRGCPRNCPFCLVSDLEGKKVVEDDGFLPAPNIGDNNILMTSREHQELVVEREMGCLPHHLSGSRIDVNSGFDCRVFQNDMPYYYKLWGCLPLKMWRFAFDEPESEQAIRRVLAFFKEKGLDRHTVQVYVLCNFPGVDVGEVMDRAEIIKGYGMQPYLMKYVPVTSTTRGYYADEEWKFYANLMIAYYNQPKIWMSCSWEEFFKTKTDPAEVGC